MENYIAEQLRKSDAQPTMCPRIESDESDEPLLKDTFSTFLKLTQNRFNDISCGFIHGKMDYEQKQSVMRVFSWKIKLLISTSVIEVGIDVPDASLL